MRVLEVALLHAELDTALPDQIVDRVATWLNERPRQRDRMRELLVGKQSGRQSLPMIEYAAILSRHEHLQRPVPVLGPLPSPAPGLTSGQAVARLAELLHISDKTVEARLTIARKLLDQGDLAEWEAVLRPLPQNRRENEGDAPG